MIPITWAKIRFVIRKIYILSSEVSVKKMKNLTWRGLEFGLMAVVSLGELNCWTHFTALAFYVSKIQEDIIFMMLSISSTINIESRARRVAKDAACSKQHYANDEFKTSDGVVFVII